MTNREELIVEDLGSGVRQITVNRPSTLNALNQSVREGLVTVLNESSMDPEVRTVVLTGAGRRAFSSGQDLRESATFDGRSTADWIDQWGAVFDALVNSSIPTVAMINGYAVGAGLQLAACCDIRVAADHASLGLPEVNDAIPCITGVWALKRLVNLGRISDLVLTGRLINASVAEHWGLVTRVVPLSELAGHSLQLAKTLASKDVKAMELTKRNMSALRWSDWPDASRIAKEGHGQVVGSGGPQEAMQMFLEHDRGAAGIEN